MLRERQEAITRVCFGLDVAEADLVTLGEAERWRLYRRMVRTRIVDMVRAGLPRSAAKAGDARFGELTDAWLAAAPPASRYLRDVVLEFVAFVERGDAGAAASPFTMGTEARDLLTYEAARWRVAHGDWGPVPTAAEFRFEGVPAVNPAHGLIAVSHAVVEERAAGESMPPRDARVLVYRRTDNFRVGALALTAFEAEVFGAWTRGTTARDGAAMAASKLGMPINDAFVQTLGAFTAVLLERTVLLGTQAPADSR